MGNKEDIYYDAFLLWNVNNVCNLHCDYCFDNLGKDNYLYSNPVPTFKSKIMASLKRFLLFPAKNYPARTSPKPKALDIHAVMKTLGKTNKTYCITLSGGEPFSVPNIIDVCLEMTGKHILSINTNLTSDKIKDFAKMIDPNRVKAIAASCHIKEMERLDMLDEYIRNFHLCKEKGFNIRAVEVAYPPLLNEAEKYREFFRKNGIHLEFIQFCGRHNGRLYPESYTDEELVAVGLKNALTIQMFHSRRKLCNAGYNACVVYPDGDVRPCFGINESIGNIFSDITFKKSLMTCPCELCACPLKINSGFLFEKATAECKVK